MNSINGGAVIVGMSFVLFIFGARRG